MSGRFVVDTASSRIAVRTRAQGFLSALAHDLEIASTALRGRVVEEGDTWSAEIALPVESLHVVGVLRGERVDQNALSPADRADIQARLRREVLVAGEVVVTARGTTRDRGEVTFAVAGAQTTVPTTFQVLETGGRLQARGRAEITLSSLRIREVKGPLGAFKVANRVELLYELSLVPESLPQPA